MRNIIKIVIVMFTSITLFSSANAGELTVTGSAKATYNIVSGFATQSKGVGVTNEFDLGANGELDNGYTWNYKIAMDPDNTAGGTAGEVQNDDTSLTLTTPYGTLGVFSKTGALDVEDAASQSVYGRPTDIGDPSATVDNFTIDGYNNLQYHLPTDLLPFEVSAKIAYAPGLDATQNSGNATGVATTKSATNMGDTATEYQLSMVPVEGAKIGASYIEFKNSGNGITAQSGQEPRSGAAYIKYATGPVSLGYSMARRDNILSGATIAAGTIEWYDQQNVSVAYNVNDALSVSAEIETSETNKVSITDVEVEQKSTGVQAAYTMGGMTLALSYAKHDNNGYVNNADANQTLLAVSMAF